MKYRTLSIQTILLSLLLSGVALAHPSDSYETYSVEGARYASLGMPASAALGSITFSSSYSAPASLSHQERYILTGGKQNDSILLSWYLEIYYVLADFYVLNHRLPSELTDQVLAQAIHDGQPLPSSTLQRFHSPLTERYPRLDSASFSPGDLYVQVLTDSEIRHFTQYDMKLKAYYERRPLPAPYPATEVSQLAGPVFYMRIYGNSGVIMERLVYEGTPVH